MVDLAVFLKHLPARAGRVYLTVIGGYLCGFHRPSFLQIICVVVVIAPQLHHLQDTLDRLDIVAVVLIIALVMRVGCCILGAELIKQTITLDKGYQLPQLFGQLLVLCTHSLFLRHRADRLTSQQNAAGECELRFVVVLVGDVHLDLISCRRPQEALAAVEL